MAHNPDRRAFLASAGVTVASAFVSRALGQTTITTRESVADMDEGHPTLVAYRTAVAAMRQLDTTDPQNPLGWTFQGNMHGVPAGGGTNAAWKWCMHGNWWFLPWHRGYLYFFERIIRKMSGDDTFALPYWPWELPGQDVLPAPFRVAMYQGAPNALFDGTRTIANQGGPLQPGPFSTFAGGWAYAKTMDQFTDIAADLSFGGVQVPKTTLPQKPVSQEHGVMESQAHDQIHVLVGSSRPNEIDGNMRHPQTAARDPIFWLHHTNVDRLWNQWLAVQGHDNPTDQDWYDQQFPFIDENGNTVTLTVTEILNRAASAYHYDDERRLMAARVNRGARREAPVQKTIVGVASVQPALKLGTTPFRKTLTLDASAKPKLMAALRTPVTNAEPATVLLRIEGIRPPAKPSVTFDVFLVKPGEGPSQRAYVGVISFFGREDHGHNEGFTQGFDVTRVVQAIRRANKDELPELQVLIVPHSTAGLSDADLAKEKTEVPISNVTLKLVSR
ncbi:MAG TPA: tyrosinase family protein [Gemmataceae bacterium]|jgi:tyrosinase